MSAVAWRDELAGARAIAAERRKTWDEAPELTAEEIIAGFQRELRSIVVSGFGTVYYYHPMSITERLEFEAKLEVAEDGTTTAANMVQAIIAFARNSDGSQKFKPEHASALLAAPDAEVFKLATTVIGSHRFSVVSAEKK